jgi:hypothetical protein
MGVCARGGGGRGPRRNAGVCESGCLMDGAAAWGPGVSGGKWRGLRGKGGKGKWPSAQGSLVAGRLLGVGLGWAGGAVPRACEGLGLYSCNPVCRPKNLQVPPRVPEHFEKGGRVCRSLMERTRMRTLECVCVRGGAGVRKIGGRCQPAATSRAA